MGILVDTIRVAGFRGLNNLEISLAKVVVLIGANNCGKTSLLKALSLVLGDYFRWISEEDFHIGSDEKKVSQIIVDIRIVPFDGKIRSAKFNEDWATEFGYHIRSEANGNQYLPVRARSNTNSIKGGFETEKLFLEKWPSIENWTTEKIKTTKANKLESLHFLSVEAQRDVHQDLKAKTSYIGRVLSNVSYDTSAIEGLEEQIKNINLEAVEKSETLKKLKHHLEKLHNSFEGAGTAEITPFPKKFRDLSKNFSIHIGEGREGVFPMEYHGMGTRSWASFLTVKAFSDLIAEKHAAEVKPFFSILAAEEPEAHLHPNAQKALYRQLSDTSGQVVVSTHSPYLAALANCQNLRLLKRNEGKVTSHILSILKGSEEERRLEREILNTRGEILFSKAIVLCEGETEEQALPRLFSRFFNQEAFEFGLSFVGVSGSGAKYKPFLQLCRDFEIPFFIFSDGEDQPVQSLKKVYEEVFNPQKFEDCKSITILKDVDFEQYLVDEGHADQFIAAIKSVDGDTAFEDWRKKTHGQVKKRKQNSSKACDKCNQPKYEDQLWDFDGSEGKIRALLRYIESNKVKIAPAMAEQLCLLPIEKLPKKITDFFVLIKERISP